VFEEVREPGAVPRFVPEAYSVINGDRRCRRGPVGGEHDLEAIREFVILHRDTELGRCL